MRVLVLAFVVLAEVAMARPTPQGLPLVGDLLGHAPAPHGFLPPGGNHGIVGNLVDSLLGPNALNLDLCLNLKLGDGPQSFAPRCPNYVLPPPPPFPFPYPGYLARREHKRGLLDNLLPGLTAPLAGGPPGAPFRPNKGLVVNLLEALLGPNVLDLDLCLDLNLGGGPQSYAPRCPNYMPVPVGIPPPFGPVGPLLPPPIGPPGPIGPPPPASYSVAPFYRRDVEKRDLAILGGPGSYGAPILPPPPMPLPPPPAPYIEGPPILPPLLPAPLPPMPVPSAPYMGAPPLPPLPPIVSPIDEDCEIPPPPPPPHGLAPYHEAQPFVPPPMPVPAGPAYEVLPPIVGPSPLPFNRIPLPPPVVPLPPVYESGPPPPVPFVPVVPEYNGVPPPPPPPPMLPPPPPFMPVGPPPPPPMPIGPPPLAPAPIGPPPPPVTSIANDVVLAYTNTANGNMPAICIPVPYPVATGPGAALPPPPPLGGPVYNAIMPPLM
ncbi:hypothetical protein LPJ66_000013 [Kickxella alabastrina]|uniref:Uncharacterized protein n=1 Tax=Kickxella alabastrina TaxID=61397 RepID=A0ACC1IX93_9FUNG|nr:hypothetical protein LPJ66_000013 [Kickxella alabastrina]